MIKPLGAAPCTQTKCQINVSHRGHIRNPPNMESIISDEYPGCSTADIFSEVGQTWENAGGASIASDPDFFLGSHCRSQFRTFSRSPFSPRHAWTGNGSDTTLGPVNLPLVGLRTRNGSVKVRTVPSEEAPRKRRLPSFPIRTLRLST